MATSSMRRVATAPGTGRSAEARGDILQGKARSVSLLDLVGLANSDPFEVPSPQQQDPDAHPAQSLARAPSLYDLVDKADDAGSADADIKARVRTLILASFFMSACNTMQSILYVPPALAITGSAKGANLLLATLHSVCAMLDIFVAPSFGALTDTVGRKFPLLVLSGSLCLSRFLMLLQQRKRTLAVSRIVGYFTASLFSNTLVASILDITHGRSDLASVYRAMDSSAKGWGVVVGPWLAGLLAKRSFGRGVLSNTKLPFILSGSFAALCFVWVTVSVRESLPVEKRKPFKPKAKNLLGCLELLGHGSQMNRVVLMSIVADIGSRTAPIFAVTTKAMFGWDTETTARWLLCYGLGMALGPGLVAKHKVHRFGLRGAHVLDNIGMTVAATMLACSRKGKLFWTSLLVYLYSLGFGPGGRAMQMQIATSSIPNVGKGELTGRFSSLASISNMLSPQLFAGVFAATTSESAPFNYPGSPFAVAAFTNFIYGVLLCGISTTLVPWGKPNSS